VDFDCDAVVIGAGVAGSAAAILLARAGWSVVVVEQHAYPRRKVCGECIAPGNLPLLDELGVGPEFHAAAGPELRRVGWMDSVATVSADMPACLRGAYRYGRALGRDRLDELLLRRARAVGVQVLQPARVRYVMGETGAFECGIEACARSPAATARGVAGSSRLRTPIVVDAHGSWERGPFRPHIENPPRRRRASDLFAFKATFRNTSLQPGYLPVLALHGGYGGMVVADDGRTTLACCIRRDALAACRAAAPGVPAGNAIERFLRGSCRGVRDALRDAELDAPWLSVGPLR
jgi:2-polyprenyl-6-methoxyphenol hydroxylase-like FAD-dependent oxidoreductase